MSQEEIDTPLAEFREMATKGGAAIDRNFLHFYAHHKADDNQLIFVYFSDERNVGVTTMRKFLQQLEDKNIGRGIIIYQEKMTSSAHKVGIVFTSAHSVSRHLTVRSRLSFPLSLCLLFF